MDNFLNLAKQGLEKFSEGQGGQGDFNVQGGSQWNSPHHSQQGNGESFQAGSGHNIGHDVDANQAIQAASYHAEGTGSSDLFNQALGFLHQNKDQHSQPVNEQHVLNAHDQAYNQGNASRLDASSLGGAAAMQILKQFTGGSSGTGSGNNQTQLIGRAMSEAAKLFEASGASSGSKQDAVNSAAMTVMKLVVQSKFSGGVIGGSGSSGIMGLVSKFM